VIALVGALLIAAQGPSPVDQATAALTAQAAAWNKGNVEEALGLYCDRPDMTWVSRSGVTRGFQAFAEGMRKDFKDPQRMGVMQFRLLDSRPLGRGQALTTIRWEITRAGSRIMGGVSTQLWQRCDGRLRVVLEHAS
jgi:hypothetical protein